MKNLLVELFLLVFSYHIVEIFRVKEVELVDLNRIEIVIYGINFIEVSNL